MSAPYSREESTTDEKAPEWKTLLQPYAERWYELLQPLALMDTEDLQALLDATGQVTGVNCWYATYDVAGILAGEITREFARRALRGVGGTP